MALARALASSPALLLLDEPLAALDVETRTAVRTELRAALDGFAGPAVLVTHDPLEAMTLADRLVVLEGGRVVQDGAVAAVTRRPATPYVARLVGLTLLRGVLHDRVLAVDGGGRLATTAAGTGPALAVVRPSAVAVSTEAPHATSVRNTWPGRVRGLEVLGDRVRLDVDARPAVLVDVTPQAVAELRLAAGDPVWLSVKATEVDVYPAG